MSYHCKTGVRASAGSSFTMGWALVRPRNSGLPYTIIITFIEKQNYTTLYTKLFFNTACTMTLGDSQQGTLL